MRMLGNSRLALSPTRPRLIRGAHFRQEARMLIEEERANEFLPESWFAMVPGQPRFGSGERRVNQALSQPDSCLCMEPLLSNSERTT
jgi:hypothetical protein